MILGISDFIQSFIVTEERIQGNIASLQFHLLEIGTLSKKHLSPEYFDCWPPLTEIEQAETEQTEPPISRRYV